jgi:hypothetical protein
MEYIRKNRLKFKPKNDQLDVVKCEEYSFKHLQNASESVQLEAVRHYKHAIKYIKNASEKVQLEAIESHGDSFRYIDNPCDRVIDVIEYLYYNERTVFDRHFEIIE